MIRRSLVIGATTVALLGGGAAVAYASGPTSGTPAAPASPSVPATPGSSASAAPGKGHPALRAALRNTVQATWVTRTKKGTFVTHDAIRGQVATVSSGSISVHAADGTTETFSVSSATKVRKVTLSPRSVTDSTIAQVSVGDRVVVTGVGTGTPAARLVRVVTK